MKNAIISSVILLLIFVLVGINTAVVDNMLSDTIKHAEALEVSESIQADFEDLKSTYEKRAKYINLTVSHVMMSEVEEAFAELEGAIRAADNEGTVEAKSRLTDALGQLKRLAGLSFDSII